MLTECLHAECFRRVMAAVKHVEAKVLGVRERPVRPFAGDEGGDPLVGRGLYLRAGAAGDHADLSASCRAARQHRRLGAGGFGLTLGQLRARPVKHTAQADRLAALGEKRFGRLDAKRATKPRIVAEPRMRVKR